MEDNNANDEQALSLADYWIGELKKAGKRQEKWEKQAEGIDDRYRDKRSEGDEGVKRFNILWSNVETLRAAFYSKSPKPQASRRHKDQDPVGRQAAMVIERALEYCIDSYDFDDEIKACVEDYLLPGRAVARIVYKPYFEKVEIEVEVVEGEEPKETEYEEELSYEEAYIDYVYWKDFRYGAARKWSNVPWVAYRHYMSKKTLEARFGEELARSIPTDAKLGCDDHSTEEDEHKTGKAAEVWEIWSKGERKVYWVAPSFKDKVLKVEPVPLELDGVFPSPRPLFANKTNKNLIPVPDYHEYQDQAIELDVLTARINVLSKALKVVGVYAADADALKTMLTENVDNELIPIADWAMYAERGGIDGMVSWLPIDQVIKALISLYEARESTKQELYEITGLSDIIRGSSVASETATAQRIKGQFATLRLSDRQDEVSRFIRDLLRLKAEVICEQFSPETIQLISGLPLEPQVYELISNDPVRGFRIDIETDSTLQVDEEADKRSRIEFMEASMGFLERAIPAFQNMPELGPLMAETLMFGIRGFRAGRELEDAFEQALEEIGNKPPQQGGNPEAEAKAAKIQQDMEIDGAKAKQDMTQNSQQHAVSMQKAEQDLELTEAKAVNDLLKP